MELRTEAVAPQRMTGGPKPAESLRRERALPDYSVSVRRAIGNQGLGKTLPDGSGDSPQPLPSPIQTKLRIGKVDDPLEYEADRVARQVIDMPAPPTARATPGSAAPALQRKCDCDGTCPECSGNESDSPEEPVRMKAQAQGSGQATAPAAVHQALRGAGQPLRAETLGFFEPRFGQGFAPVRVHTGPEAEAAAESIGARAFTAGKNIVFGKGEFTPGTRRGDELLAHELTHVVQQDTGTVRRQPAPENQSPLKDPISGNEVPGFGFWATGPDFNGPPLEQDIRQVLIENGIADAGTLGECTVDIFNQPGGHQYFAYTSPAVGVVARAYAEHFNPSDKTSDYVVYAYLSDTDKKKQRPPGGSGQTRMPSLNAISPTQQVNFTDLDANLRVIEARLAALLKRYSGLYGDISLAVAKAGLAANIFRTKLAADPAQKAIIDNAVQLIEWSEYDLSLIDQQRQKLADSGTRVTSVDRLLTTYATVFDKLFQSDAMAAYAKAQQQSERLPADILLDSLRAEGEKDPFGAAGLKNSPSAVLVAWVDSLRGRLDAMDQNRQALAANPSDAKLKQAVQSEADFLGSALRAIQIYAEYVFNFLQFVSNRPGVFDTPLVAAMSRLRVRVDTIRAAYDAHDAKTLKTLVDAFENDKGIKSYYSALPAAMQVTQMVGRLAVATIAAIATGGISGLVTGGARAAATGLTLRGALTFAGTATLEAATFTVINAAASKVLFNDKITFGSLLKDFAWNLGLFAVLRGASGVSTAVLRAAELEVLSAPVHLAVGFPLAHGWGVLRFRVEQDRWPTSAELDQMTAQAVLLLAGVAVGSKGVQRWLEAHKKATALPILYREYGWRFESLESIRVTLGERVSKAEATGKGNDQTEVDGAKADAQTLEKKFQELLDTLVKDRRFTAEQVRKELNDLREAAPDVAAQLITDVLGIPADAGIRRAGSASYTYANGKTNAVEKAVGPKYRVAKNADPVSGLRTLTATAADAPTLTFAERAAGGLDFDTGVFDVQKLMAEFSLTTAESQRMMWRLLSDNGIAKDPKQATTVTRRQVKALAKQSGKSAEETLGDLSKGGRLRNSTPAPVVAMADGLDKSGILSSSEWLDIRDPDNRRGVVGEWLAKDAVAAPAGARVFRQVTVIADLFEDPAGTVPAKSADGRLNVNFEAVETDLVYGHDVSGGVEADTIINVKASGEKGMAKSAGLQNANFESVLNTKPGGLAQLSLSDGTRYARIKSITALEGAGTVNLTGKLNPSATIAKETVGPKGAGGFTKTLPQTADNISTIAALLYELQLIRSGVY